MLALLLFHPCQLIEIRDFARNLNFNRRRIESRDSAHAAPPSQGCIGERRRPNPIGTDYSHAGDDATPFHVPSLGTVSLRNAGLATQAGGTGSTHDNSQTARLAADRSNSSQRSRNLVHLRPVEGMPRIPRGMENDQSIESATLGAMSYERPSSFASICHLLSMSALVFASMVISFGQGRPKPSLDHLRVASMPIFEP